MITTVRLVAFALAIAICVATIAWPHIVFGAATGHAPSTRSGATHGPRPIVCQPLFVCDIVLDPGETILAMATGDSARWMLSTVMSGPDASIPHVLVKPTEYSLRTDLIIASDKRVCYAILVSTPRDYRGRIRLYYPVAEFAITTPSQAISTDGSDASLSRFDFAYRMRGDRRIMPIRVMNDGAHTYIQMPATIQDMPVVVMIANDGSDAMINYRFRHGMFVVDGVPDRLALIQGTGRGQRRVTIERGN